MKKLFSLLKAILSDGVQLFNYRGETRNSRRLLPLILTLLMGALMLFSTLALATELKKDGKVAALLPLFTLVTAIIILTEGIYKSGDLLFRPRDNDLLLSMPIPKSTLVLARLIKFYLFELLYCLIFLLPAIIAYAVNSEITFSFLVAAVLVLLLTPAIPIALSCLIGLLISALSSRFRHRSLLQVILSFLSLFLVAALIPAANAAPDLNGSFVVSAGEVAAEIYYPAAVFGRLATNFNLLELLIFVALNLLVITATVFLISRFYFQIITRLNITRRPEKTSPVNYRFQKHSQLFAVVRKEVTKYFNTPVLLTNTMLGLVLFLVAIVVLCLQFDEVANNLISSVENFPLTLDELHSYLPTITFALVTFSSLMTFISATMISLEGRAFNFLKSLPVSGRKIIFAKVFAATLLIVPITLVGSLMMIFRFQFQILDALLVLAGVIAVPLITELIGILVNLRYPRFDAESDAAVVKQSASILVTTFIGLGLVLFSISLTFVLVYFFGQTAGLLLMDLLFLAFVLLLSLVVAVRGEVKYRSLAA